LLEAKKVHFIFTKDLIAYEIDQKQIIRQFSIFLDITGSWQVAFGGHLRVEGMLLKKD
jgi:hypothetical protein